jgi:uncharacterized protein (DUF2147 family)
MKFILLLTTLLLSLTVHAQSIEGVWQNIDDEDGKPKSHIEVKEVNGKLEGRVIKLLEGADLKVCTKCKGARKDQPIEGMKIMWDLQAKGDDKAEGGRIIDPKKGKEYGCKIKLKEDDLLEVRGYLGSPIFGRTQHWHRIK